MGAVTNSPGVARFGQMAPSPLLVAAATAASTSLRQVWFSTRAWVRSTIPPMASIAKLMSRHDQRMSRLGQMGAAFLTVRADKPG